MADNAAMRDALRRAADSGRRAAESVGVRSTTVTIRLRTYAAAVGTSTGTVTATTDTVLDPRPKVNQVTEGKRSYFGGSVLAESGGRLLAGEYEIGPITQDFTGGGYLPTELAPVGAANKRVTVILAGDEFKSGGEEFEIVKMDATKPHRIMLQVGRARQGA